MRQVKWPIILGLRNAFITISVVKLQIYRKARIKNVDKLKKKLEYLDDGESVKLEFISGDDNVYIESLKPEGFKFAGEE